MQKQAILVRDEHGQQLAVVSDPYDTSLDSWFTAQSNEAYRHALAEPQDLREYLFRCEQLTAAFSSSAANETGSSSADQTLRVSVQSLASADVPAVQSLNAILFDAMKAGASDIHLESSTQGLDVRYRLDGVLSDPARVGTTSLGQQLMSRLKVLACLDISETRTPQDGSFQVEILQRDTSRTVDLRISIVPGAHGEDAVIRILDKQRLLGTTGQLTLDSLGFDSKAMQLLRSLMSAEHGMLLVTGPTGSGKTTTLYAALAELHHSTIKIITIEDPVEYQIPGVLQIPVNDKKGLTFAKGLRSILRHDPDKIMVGEIRDRETAEIAVQSALTGHLVLTSVHANSVFDVFSRFAHMGIDAYAFAASLRGVWAQRLLRRVCPHCSIAIPAPSALGQQLAADSAHFSHQSYVRKAASCSVCRGTGYLGRCAVAEVLPIHDELRQLLIDKAPQQLVRESAQRQGVRALRTAALELALQGHTTIEEVNRVIPDA
jgi:general secretion pathway protein E